MHSAMQTEAFELPEIAREVGNYIAGIWENNEVESFKARNPATNAVLAELPRSSRKTAQRAIEAAAIAQKTWSRKGVWERAALCARLGDALEARKAELARLLSMEQGKPLAEALGELDWAIHGFHTASEQIKYLTGEVIPGVANDRRVLLQRYPRGVYAVVTPWNFPVNIPVEYIAPGIAAGNAIVWVPAPSTSLIAVALMRVIAEAGIPDGLVNLVLGDGATVGDEIVSNPGTHAIGFTGSTATGRAIAARGAGKPMILELGGNGPLIVRRDADLAKAAAAAALGAFYNCGQVCSATGRVLADAAIAAELADLIARIADTQIVGDPLRQGTTMGPLNNGGIARKVRAHVEQASSAGARCVTGGRPLPHCSSELFFAPTVLAEVTPDMQVAREETFGPVVPIIALASDDDMLRVAKHGGYGLSMGIFSRDIDAALAMGSELSAGIVNINEGTFYWEPHMPFGGSSGSASGIGRIGGKYALESMTEVRTISIPFPAYEQR